MHKVLVIKAPLELVKCSFGALSLQLAAESIA